MWLDGRGGGEAGGGVGFGAPVRHVLLGAGPREAGEVAGGWVVAWVILVRSSWPPGQVALGNTRGVLHSRVPSNDKQGVGAL